MCNDVHVIYVTMKVSRNESVTHNCRRWHTHWDENHYIIIPSVCLCDTEVRALYGCLSCGWLRVATLATLGSGRGWLGAVVARHAAGRSGRCASYGSFLNGRGASTAGFRRPTLQFKPQSQNIKKYKQQTKPDQNYTKTRIKQSV